MSRFISVTLLVLVCALTGAAYGPFLIDEHWEDGLDFWVVQDGNWSVDEEGLLFDPVGFGDIYIDGPDWLDYVVEVEFEVLEYAQYGYFRLFLRDQARYQAYGINILENAFFISRFEGDWDKRVDLFPLVWNGYAPVGQRVVLRATATENRLKVELGGRVFEVEDPEDQYIFGAIRLRFDNARGRIYRVQAWEL